MHRHLSTIGRLFYGIAMTAFGVLTIGDRDFPYFLIPPKHHWLTEHSIIIYISGLALILAGLSIILNKKLQQTALILGTVLLAIFVFYFLPYQLSHDPTHFGAWENSAKELALAGGAWTLTNSGAWTSTSSGTWISKSNRKNLGTLIFAITIISFGIDHFLFAKEAQGYIPAWIPAKLFWMYVTGTALLLSGTAIALNIKSQLAATLLGAMIGIWVLILHIPYAIASPKTETSSAFLALAYCGIAFIIAGKGATKK